MIFTEITFYNSPTLSIQGILQECEVRDTFSKIGKIVKEVRLVVMGKEELI